MELCRGEFCGAAALGGAVGAGSVSFAKTAGVDAKDGKAAFGEGWSGRNGRGVGAQEFIFSDVVLAAVPMAVEDGGNAVRWRGCFREEEVSANDFCGSVVELEFLEPIGVTVLSPEGEWIDFWTGRTLSQKGFQARANGGALLRPLLCGPRRKEGRGRRSRLQPTGAGWHVGRILSGGFHWTDQEEAKRQEAERCAHEEAGQRVFSVRFQRMRRFLVCRPASTRSGRPSPSRSAALISSMATSSPERAVDSHWEPASEVGE